MFRAARACRAAARAAAQPRSRAVALRGAAAAPTAAAAARVPAARGLAGQPARPRAEPEAEAVPALPEKDAVRLARALADGSRSEGVLRVLRGIRDELAADDRDELVSVMMMWPRIAALLQPIEVRTLEELGYAPVGDEAPQESVELGHARFWASLTQLPEAHEVVVLNRERWVRLIRVATGEDLSASKLDAGEVALMVAEMCDRAGEYAPPPMPGSSLEERHRAVFGDMLEIQRGVLRQHGHEGARGWLLLQLGLAEHPTPKTQAYLDFFRRHYEDMVARAEDASPDAGEFADADGGGDPDGKKNRL